MRAEYKRDVSRNYLILHGENQVDTASYQVRMLTGNAVPSILKCRIQGLDGRFLFYYDITSRQSLASFYEQKKLKASDLRIIFWRCCEDHGRNDGISSESGSAVVIAGIYVSGCGKTETVFLLSARRSKGSQRAVPGDDRIFPAETGP